MTRPRMGRGSFCDTTSKLKPNGKRTALLLIVCSLPWTWCGRQAGASLNVSELPVELSRASHSSRAPNVNDDKWASFGGVKKQEINSSSTPASCCCLRDVKEANLTCQLRIKWCDLRQALKVSPTGQTIEVAKQLEVTLSRCCCGARDKTRHESLVGSVTAQQRQRQKLNLNLNLNLNLYQARRECGRHCAKSHHLHVADGTDREIPYAQVTTWNSSIVHRSTRAVAVGSGKLDGEPGTRVYLVIMDRHGRSANTRRLSSSWAMGILRCCCGKHEEKIWHGEMIRSQSGQVHSWFLRARANRSTGRDKSRDDDSGQLDLEETNVDIFRLTNLIEGNYSQCHDDNNGDCKLIKPGGSTCHCLYRLARAAAEEAPSEPSAPAVSYEQVRVIQPRRRPGAKAHARQIESLDEGQREQSATADARAQLTACAKVARSHRAGHAADVAPRSRLRAASNSRSSVKCKKISSLAELQSGASSLRERSASLSWSKFKSTTRPGGGNNGDRRAAHLTDLRQLESASEGDGGDRDARARRDCNQVERDKLEGSPPSTTNKRRRGRRGPGIVRRRRRDESDSESTLNERRRLVRRRTSKDERAKGERKYEDDSDQDRSSKLKTSGVPVELRQQSRSFEPPPARLQSDLPLAPGQQFAIFEGEQMNEQLVQLLAEFYAHTKSVQGQLELMRRLNWHKLQLKPPQVGPPTLKEQKSFEQAGNQGQEKADQEFKRNHPERKLALGHQKNGNNLTSDQTSGSPPNTPTPQQDEESERHQDALLKMHLGADEESLLKWFGQRQSQFGLLKNLSFELIHERPNRTINVCPDGPKILVLPNVSDILYCYTREQWVDKLWSDLRLSAFHYPIILLNILIFLFGTTGNIFVCLSVKRNHQLRSVTNYFIVNLAFADFLVILICLPATVVWDLSLTWFFDTIPCKLIMFLQDVSISVSVLTLTAISIDRYYAICHPLKFKTSLSQAKHMIALIWLVSLVIMTPDLIYLRAKPSADLSEAGLDTVLYSDCNYNWSNDASRAFQFVKTIVLYLLPFVLMFWAHYRILQVLRLASSMMASSTYGEEIAIGPGRKSSVGERSEGLPTVDAATVPLTNGRATASLKQTAIANGTGQMKSTAALLERALDARPSASLLLSGNQSRSIMVTSAPDLRQEETELHLKRPPSMDRCLCSNNERQPAIDKWHYNHYHHKRHRHKRQARIGQDNTQEHDCKKVANKCEQHPSDPSPCPDHSRSYRRRYNRHPRRHKRHRSTEWSSCRLSCCSATKEQQLTMLEPSSSTATYTNSPSTSGSSALKVATEKPLQENHRDNDRENSDSKLFAASRAQEGRGGQQSHQVTGSGGKTQQPNGQTVGKQVHFQDSNGPLAGDGPGGRPTRKSSISCEHPTRAARPLKTSNLRFPANFRLAIGSGSASSGASTTTISTNGGGTFSRKKRGAEPISKLNTKEYLKKQRLIQGLLLERESSFDCGIPAPLLTGKSQPLSEQRHSNVDDQQQRSGGNDRSTYPGQGADNKEPKCPVAAADGKQSRLMGKHHFSLDVIKPPAHLVLNFSHQTEASCPGTSASQGCANCKTTLVAATTADTTTKNNRNCLSAKQQLLTRSRSICTASAAAACNHAPPSTYPAGGGAMTPATTSARMSTNSPALILTMHNKSKLESRRKAAKMLTAIVVLFGICYLPVHLINFLRQFIDDIPQTDVTSTISMLSHCVCYLNSAINPIIYNHMNSVFRAEFRKFLSCLDWRSQQEKKLPQQHQQQQPTQHLMKQQLKVGLRP